MENCNLLVTNLFLCYIELRGDHFDGNNTFLPLLLWYLQYTYCGSEIFVCFLFLQPPSQQLLTNLSRRRVPLTKQRAQNHASDDQHMWTECGRYTHLSTTA